MLVLLLVSVMGVSASAAPAPSAPAVGSTVVKTSQSSVASLTPASGQSSAQANNIAGPTPGRKRFGASAAMTYSASARSTADTDRSSETDLEIAPWAAVGRHLTMDGYLGISRPTNGYRETRFADGRIGIFRNSMKLSQHWLFRPKATLFLPLNSDNRTIHSFRTGLNLAGRLMFATGALQGFYQLSGTQNFYRYTTTGTGESNPARSLSHVVKGVYSWRQMYFDLTGSVASRWTFAGTPSTTFGISEEIGFSEGQWSIGLGHSNSDSLYQANGSETNLTFFSGYTSKYYVSASVFF